jgi:undecaprenyl-diphosphatase
MDQFIFLLQFILITLSHFLNQLQKTDIHLLALIDQNRITYLDSFFIFITNVATLITYAIPIILMVYAYIKHRFELQRKSWLVLIALTLNSTIIDTIKNVVQRPRPFLIYPFIKNLITVHSSSFPSGHTAEVSLLAIAVSILFPKQKWGIVLAWVWAIIIAYSRMDLGVHYPSDILGSFIISIIVAFAFIKWMIALGFIQKQ